MFDVPFAACRRPMFGVSAALHAALVLALVVPPLLATPEPPEPEVRMLSLVPFVSVHVGDGPARAEKDLLRKGNESRATARVGRTTSAHRRAYRRRVPERRRDVLAEEPVT
jgi:hypothetical protein